MVLSSQRWSGSIGSAESRCKKYGPIQSSGLVGLTGWGGLTKSFADLVSIYSQLFFFRLSFFRLFFSPFRIICVEIMLKFDMYVRRRMRCYGFDSIDSIDSLTCPKSTYLPYLNYLGTTTHGLKATPGYTGRCS